jgi:RNA polymerase sigma factor (sigma-70 family)
MRHLRHLFSVRAMLAAGAPAWPLGVGCGGGALGQVRSAEEFAEFAEGMYPQLRRTAFLLCGDWHTAEDLAQTALAKVFVSWRKIRRQDAMPAYTHRILVNTYLAHRRLKRTGEFLTAWFPDSPVLPPAPETRMLLLDALATLPSRARAVVVLRYWEDLSVQQVGPLGGHREEPQRSLPGQAAGSAG